MTRASLESEDGLRFFEAASSIESNVFVFEIARQYGAMKFSLGVGSLSEIFSVSLILLDEFGEEARASYVP